MRKLLQFMGSVLSVAGCALLFAGCERNLEQEEYVTFTATVSSEMNSTKATIYNDGTGSNVNRCIMEVYYDDQLYVRDSSKVSTSGSPSVKTASFNVKLVANRTYDVAFWADCVDDVNNAIGTDKYYNTENGLRAITIDASSYIGNNDKRDAFFYGGQFSISQQGTSNSVKLVRPFAQINVITENVQTITLDTGTPSTQLDVTIKDVYISFNALTGEPGTKSELNYSSGLYNFPSSTGSLEEATLSMDYIFAPARGSTINIEWAANKGKSGSVEHSFSMIPYCRNYRTNIKGSLLDKVILPQQ